jgi:hypothetical protein
MLYLPGDRGPARLRAAKLMPSRGYEGRSAYQYRPILRLPSRFVGDFRHPPDTHPICDRSPSPRIQSEYRTETLLFLSIEKK